MLPAIAGLLVVVLNGAGAVHAQTPVTAGFRDFSYGTTVTPEPTGEKAESKLWWNDGTWWGSLFSVSANRYRIHRLNATTQAWIDTGTALDDRRNTKADVLWDAASQKLYVVSHVFSTSAKANSSSSNWGRLYRYSYNTAQRTYTLDSGFPVHVTQGTAEVLTVAKDSTGRLWVTHVEGSRVKINWSVSSDLDWGTPINLPVTASTIAVNSDDISAIVAFGGAQVGVMWSNQATRSVYFAYHRDNQVPTAWTLETVLPNVQCPSGACADDHISLQTDSIGRVFGAVKTSLSGQQSPIIMLVVRAPAGVWTDYTVNVGTDNSTRPIVVVDDEQGRVHVVTAAGGNIYMKSAVTDQIAFTSGRGELIVSSNLDTNINNPTSSKHNVSPTTGLVVLASDASTRFYLHNHLSLSGPPLPTVPAAPSNLSASAISSTQVNLAWTDNASNETAVHVERALGSSGAFGEIAIVGANVVTYQDTTVGAGTTYRYRVRASNAAGFSSYTNTATVSTPGAGAGVPIKDITFEGGSLTHPTSGADKVIGGVVLETTAALKGAFAAGIPNLSSAYVEESFEPSDDLYVSFYIRPRTLPATDSRILFISNNGTTVGNLVLRSNGSVRLRNGSTTFGESTALQAGQLYRLGIRQLRGAGGNAVLEGYVASGDAEFGAPFAVTTTGTWTTAGDRLRLGATTGTLDVVVDDIRLATGAMPGPSGSSQPPALPPAPSGLGANAASSSRIDLSWTDTSTDETAFHIERRSGGSFVEIAAVGANVTTYADTGVSASTAYEYRVRARNTAGYSTYSNTASATTPGTSTPPPNAPTGLGATAVSATRVDLGWTDASSDETAFHIERATGTGAFAQVATVGANVVTYSDTTVAAATTYSYRVRAANGSVMSSYSNTAVVTTPSGSGGGAGIKDITFEDGSLTGDPLGADRTTSAVVLETGAPLAGGYSARIPGVGAAYVEESFDATGDLYLSVLVRVATLPSTDVRLIQLTNGGTTVGNVLLRTSGRLRLRADSTAVGSESAALVPGQVYRIGVRQKQGSGGNAILEGFLAPAGQAFGAAFATTSAGTWVTPADRLRLGSTASASAAIDVTVDDVRLAAGAMPQ